MLLIEPAKLETRSAKNIPVAELGELLAARLRFCSESDQLLLEMLHKNNLSRRKIARLTNRSPGAVARRVRRVINRLSDPLIVALTDPACTLPLEYRELGVQYFLQDLSIPKLMRASKRTRREVEAMIEYIRGWHRGCSGSK